MLLADIQTRQQQLWTHASKAGDDQTAKPPGFYRKAPKVDRRKGPRHWTTRRNPCDDVKEDIDKLLASNPCQSAVGLLRELTAKYPDKFGPQHRRSIQRRVVEWRNSKHNPVRDLERLMLPESS